MAKITKRIVDATKPGDRDTFLWDDALNGFGCKITPRGIKSYVLQYRPGQGGRGSPTRRYTIGRHGSPWTPDTARAEAFRLLAQVRAGHDPMATKRAVRAAAASPVAKLTTFGAVLDRFELGYRRRSAREVLRTLRKAALPLWQDRPVEQIARRDVITLLDGIEAEGHPYLRNRMHAHLHTLFNWCIGKDIITSNPAAAIPKLPEATRDRVLTEDELRRVWQACDDAGWPFGSIVRMLVLTGQRRGEVGGMRWPELGPDAMWTIPAERVKNARAHDVPLPQAAIELLTSTPRLGDGPVFTLNGSAPWNDWGAAKIRLDTLSGVTGWRLHDLRRTVATELARLGTPLHVTEKLLNHRSGSIKGIVAVYNRHEYRDERRQALEAWARRLTTLVKGGAPNVVALPRR